MTIYILLYHHNDINNDYASIEALSTNYDEIKNKFNEIKKGLLNEDLKIIEESVNYIKITDSQKEKLFEITIYDDTVSLTSTLNASTSTFKSGHPLSNIL